MTPRGSAFIASTIGQVNLRRAGGSDPAYSPPEKGFQGAERRADRRAPVWDTIVRRRIVGSRAEPRNDESRPEGRLP